MADVAPGDERAKAFVSMPQPGKGLVEGALADLRVAQVDGHHGAHQVLHPDPARCPVTHGPGRARTAPIGRTRRWYMWRPTAYRSGRFAPAAPRRGAAVPQTGRS